MGYNTIMEKTIRRGGLQTPEGYLFERTGGDLSLDFVNTVDTRPTEPRELLPTFKELFSWARQAGILSRPQEAQLMKMAGRNPKGAENARKLALTLRECLFQIGKRIADGEDVPSDLMTEWNGFVHRSMNHYELQHDKEGLSWHLRFNDLDFDSILWPVVHSAVKLLTSPNAARIRRCAADYCDWLFVDSSKRGNRRWCDMTICGNRAKAQRFYSRNKALRKPKAATVPS